ncbi:MAG: diaminopimelate decarboxylase [Armatimonadetes bacterium JP3_11]|jgi:diaminopimelate decarboxylase|nr:MAG: diaminopimelate decarboxylase [Armatimonadetes bacterium CP1_7O]OYT75784.1 MAG: diaminopimelate decarboxylase [Armatimonadetes bacterium JP3_11]RMH07937.1 MAG: diaminopimelate decarboxylase [Armatimonadota bacterium]
MLLGTQKINTRGRLEIGGCDALELAEQFGTPLYVLDETALRLRCREYRTAFENLKPDTDIVYAGKAALNRALCQIIAEEGLGLDAASGGELYTALQAGFPPARIHLHGVYKTDAELQMAIEAGVGAIVVDNFEEIERLVNLLTSLPCAPSDGKASSNLPTTTARKADAEFPILLRIAPEVDAETHPLIRTGQRDSKFGFHLLNGDAYRAVERILGDPRLRLIGFHCHIGSQISDLSAFAAAVQAMATFAQSVQQRYGYVAPLLNIGGGLAVRYVPEDNPPAVKEYARTLVDALRAACRQYGFPEPALGVEPGRSLIAEAGITLYRVGAVKHVPHEHPDLPREYLIVDGGVSDNPRPQMYGARYTAVHVGRRAEPHTHPYRILGKHCETDPIIDCAMLPETRAGDVIALLTTGAYAYSMSSQYNRYPRPAMVAVRDGNARIIVERETYDDVLRNDR